MQMPTHEKALDGAKLELIIENEPLLNDVYQANLADANKKEGEVKEVMKDHFEHGREVERRYLPSAEPGILKDDGHLDTKLVNAFPQSTKETEPGLFSKRRIKQAYVYAYPKDAKPGDEPIRFRLRRAQHYDAAGKFVADEYRIACKAHAGDNENARIETQIKFNKDDPMFQQEQRRFDVLWKMAEQNQQIMPEEGHVGSFERWYIRHKLDVKDKNDKKKEHWCEIHIERRNPPPPELEGMVRIEVEFKTDFGEKAAKKKPSLLPKWIGPGVTDEDEAKDWKDYKSGRLMKYGPPRSYFEHMMMITKERKKRQDKLDRKRAKAMKKAAQRETKRLKKRRKAK